MHDLIGKSIGREVSVESYFPSQLAERDCIALSSRRLMHRMEIAYLVRLASLLLFGDNSFCEGLRQMTCIELFLNSSFYSEHPNIYVALIPSNVISSFYEPTKFKWRDGFKSFLQFFNEDLTNFHVLDGEMDAWEQFWLSYDQAMPNNVSLTLAAIKNIADCFPNFLISLKILATLPITSCECERSISSMKMLKNYHRSTMAEERLNGLAMMYIYSSG